MTGGRNRLEIFESLELTEEEVGAVSRKTESLLGKFDRCFSQVEKSEIISYFSNSTQQMKFNSGHKSETYSDRRAGR
jgi:hypothetical protein